jgi:uncharacterized membrane protein HdeD (DUF308 family)
MDAKATQPFGRRSPQRHWLLLIDAAINLVLGVLLAVFPQPIVEMLGVPCTDTKFYPSLLGAVLIGIGVALTVEFFRKPGSPAGLGLWGAVAINLCGAVVLIAWLIVGGLEIPVRGRVFLGALATVLVLISGLELISVRRPRRNGP